jgi:uncharacterized cupin superfamily protein
LIDDVAEFGRRKRSRAGAGHASTWGFGPAIQPLDAVNSGGNPMANTGRAPALDPKELPGRQGSGYPEPFRAAVAGRTKRALGDAFGLTQFGVNLVEMPPGCWSSQRHWHSHEDEFVYVVSGELVLVTDAGETVMRPGMVAGFPGGRPDGHHLINRSEAPATYLEIGTRIPEDGAVYSDIDMEVRPRPEGRHVFVHKNGEPY